jgi:hypothetical protein
MAPVREYVNWRKNEIDKIEPYSKYYFIAEGYNTETFYFKNLIDNRRDLGFKNNIDIILLEKTEVDVNTTYPKHLVKLAKESIKSCLSTEFDKKRDKMVILFDLDIFEKKATGLDELIQLTEERYFELAITNPSFELFLLLHIDNSLDEIIFPDEKIIIENKKEGKMTPIYKLLLKKTGINCKKNPKIGDLCLSLDIAIEQEVKINQDISSFHEKITSNIGKILSQVKVKD